jgi:hypothetical protein
MKKCAYEPKERIRTLFQARSLQSDLSDDPGEMLVFDVSPRSDKSVRTMAQSLLTPISQILTHMKQPSR